MGCCDQPADSTTPTAQACCGPAAEAPAAADPRSDPRIGVRERYAAIARMAEAGTPEPAMSEGGCCGGSAALDRRSLGVGYSAEDLAVVPREADMGLGCGNPTAIAGLQAGEVVLDLGSGGGIDCFLAAQRVGPSGRVIGVDMTPEMIAKARANAAKLGHDNVEFRLGEIEHLPLADASVDVVISNCVINLSPDKAQVYAEVARILKPGGRFCVSDVLAREELSAEVRSDVALRSCCIGGADTIEATQKALAAAGFTDISIRPKDESADYIKDWGHHAEAAQMVVSCDITAHR
ncbi:MAG: methyltransferase domain-containing protein [Planctomycetota bacterium]|nr:MAG: methyltransferase domain-containing protein [Planctomycetota bacterium]